MLEPCCTVLMEGLSEEIVFIICFLMRKKIFSEGSFFICVCVIFGVKILVGLDIMDLYINY